ncbi:hypothetical protein [Prosthecobacter sp.]|uniref:hypothetical protein n=1 Tax=Prosthecobacter sp. TaxID=1965333 RepID=UPI0037835F46
MKKALLALLLATAALTSTSFADSPAQIATDYRKQAAQAVERLNQSLEKATTPLITKLVSSGDTDGAKQLTEQLKVKLTGEPVADPQPSAAQLFTMYDEARAKALAPVQKSSIARIDSMLKSAAGSKLETVNELTKVRAEIEAGKVGQRLAPAIVPQLWTYHMQPGDNNSLANIELKSNGDFTMSNTAPGKWKRAKGTDTINITFADKTTWIMTLNGDGTAMLDRPDTGRRYMKAVAEKR